MRVVSAADERDGGTLNNAIFGALFSQQTEINVRQYALESACFVVCANCLAGSRSAGADHR